MVITELRRHNFKALLTAINAFNYIIIPNILLTSNAEDALPFKLRHYNFRFGFIGRLAFSITINKSQGQTFDREGIMLPTPVFIHGQLYVAFFLVRSAKSVRVKTLASIDGRLYARNVINRKIL